MMIKIFFLKKCFLMFLVIFNLVNSSISEKKERSSILQKNTSLTVLHDDIKRFTQEIEHWLRLNVDYGLNLNVQIHFDKQVIWDPCLDSNILDFLISESSLASKGLGKYLLHLLSHPQNLYMLSYQSKSLGFTPSFDFSRYFLPSNLSYEVGGGSGAGLEIFCGDSLLIYAGGGGGGGGRLINQRSHQKFSFGGGGGGGMDIFYPSFTHAGFGGGGGMNNDFYSKGISQFHNRIDEETILWDDMHFKHAELLRVMRQCYQNGSLRIIGGGNGGGGLHNNEFKGNLKRYSSEKGYKHDEITRRSGKYEERHAFTREKDDNFTRGKNRDRFRDRNRNRYRDSYGDGDRDGARSDDAQYNSSGKTESDKSNVFKSKKCVKKYSFHYGFSFSFDSHYKRVVRHPKKYSAKSSPFALAANICGGYKNWSCICETSKLINKTTSPKWKWLEKMLCPNKASKMDQFHKAAKICGGYRNATCNCHTMKRLYRQQVRFPKWVDQVTCPGLLNDSMFKERSSKDSPQQDILIDKSRSIHEAYTNFQNLNAALNGQRDKIFLAFVIRTCGIRYNTSCSCELVKQLNLTEYWFNPMNCFKLKEKKRQSSNEITFLLTSMKDATKIQERGKFIGILVVLVVAVVVKIVIFARTFRRRNYIQINKN